MVLRGSERSRGSYYVIKWRLVIPRNMYTEYSNLIKWWDYPHLKEYIICMPPTNIFLNQDLHGLLQDNISRPLAEGNGISSVPPLWFQRWSLGAVNSLLAMPSPATPFAESFRSTRVASPSATSSHHVTAPAFCYCISCPSLSILCLGIPLCLSSAMYTGNAFIAIKVMPLRTPRASRQVEVALELFGWPEKSLALQSVSIFVLWAPSIPVCSALHRAAHDSSSFRSHL